MSRGYRWNRLMAVFLLLWLVGVVYFVSTLMTRTSEKETALQRQVDKEKQEVRRLEEENDGLRNLVVEMQEKMRRLDTVDHVEEPSVGGGGGDISDAVSRLVNGPSKEYEVCRRTIKRDVNEMWWYVRGQLESLSQKKGVSGTAAEEQLRDVVTETRLYHKAVLADLSRLAETDGHTSWRKKEAKDLSDLVQARIRALQNPEDCDSAKKLLCSLNKGCGFGCQIHHAVYCFITAYGTERMLVLKSKGWRYDKAGFEDVFHPLSETCPHEKAVSKVAWPGQPDSPAVELGIVDSVNPRPAFLPPSVPADLADRLIRLHGDPIVWWVAQFVKFMMRPQSGLQEVLDAAVSSQKLERPVVGVHVRRTDKVGTEAAFHGVEEYMKHVAEYFQELEVRQGYPVETKRVYVATDEPKVLAECRRKFPEYTFLGDVSISKSASVSNRYNEHSLRGIIVDIHMLSLTDYIVGTFSSQVSRIAYEIMQTRFPDAADRFKSLDDIWYFGGQDEHQQVAVMDHAPRGKEEIALRKGDVVGVAGNHWNGVNKGKNKRSNRVGLYPEFKTKEKIKVVDFPTYPQVKL